MGALSLGDATGLLGFGTQFFCFFFLDYKPGLFSWTFSPLRPVLTRYCGKLIFLTGQTNLLGFLYYCLRGAAAAYDWTALQTCLGGLFPAVFALGSFLTPAYYGLDHFGPEGIKIRKHIEELGYPAVHVLAHLEHAFSLPVVWIDAVSGSVPSSYGAPLGGLTALTVYMGFYTTLAHVNKHATGEWPYEIVDDVERAGGAAGRYAFFGILTGVGLGLGALGRMLAG